MFFFTKRFSLFFLLFLGMSFSLFSQNFSGKIINRKDKQPAIGASILIRETKQGVACNENGEFQVKLPHGIYHVEYRCLGYETFSEILSISEGQKEYRKIELNSKNFNLKEVVISQKEDPAYEIMRKAISKAPFYQKIVKEYEASCYIKGNMMLTKVNKLFDKLDDDGVKASEYKDKLFVQESYSTVKFTSPDKYEQTVKAFNSSIPDNKSPKETMGLFTGSLYQPKFSGCISPLHPKAFAYYKFRYEGFSEENGENINKIKVIPKLKDPELFSGYIYIADNSWDIRNADLFSSVYGINQHFEITYSKLSESVYLPTAFNNYLDGSILGYGGNFSYHSSVKYTNLVINDSVRNEIMTKPLQKKKNLNLTAEKRSERYKKVADSLATKRDSVYWNEIRNVPLTEKEQESFVKKDSLQQHYDSIRKKKTNAKFDVSDMLSGGQIGGDSTKVAFKYGGIIGALRDYNFVDGFGLGQKISMTTRLNKSKQLTISPDVYYTTARKSLAWKADIQLSYAPMRLGNLSFRLGDKATDFNSEGATGWDNTVSSFFFQKNTKMFYRNKFVTCANSIDLSNGLRLSTDLTFAKRSALQNNTTWAVFKNKENISENIQSLYFTDVASYSVGLTYTPEYYYSISTDGKKTYEYSHFPTFRMNYSEGFSSIWSNNAHFRKLDAYITQKFRTGLFSNVAYELNGGTFLGKTNQMNFADYKFFDTSGNFFLTEKNPLTTFMLLNPYTSATSDYWFSGKIAYSSKYILLKYLPFMQGKLFNESLQLNYLYAPSQKNYVEAGYYVDFFKIINCGVNISFDKMKYNSWGIRLAIPFKF